MSLTIKLEAPREVMPSVFLSLMRRMRFPDDTTPVELRRTGLTLDMEAKYTLPIDSPELLELAHSIVNGGEELHGTIYHPEPVFGYVPEIYVGLRGFNQPWFKRYRSRCDLSGELRHFTQPERYVDRPEDLKEPVEPIALRNLENYLFDVLGVRDRYRSEVLPDHAFMFREADWYTPGVCCSVYHLDVAEFARDFARIYALDRWGVRQWFTLERGQDMLQLQDADPDQNRDKGSVYRDYFEPGTEERRAVLRLLKSLTEDRVRRICQLSAERVREILNRTAARMPAIRFYDFNERGYALYSGHPSKDLWLAYTAIGEELGE